MSNAIQEKAAEFEESIELSTDLKMLADCGQVRGRAGPF